MATGKISTVGRCHPILKVWPPSVAYYGFEVSVYLTSMYKLGWIDGQCLLLVLQFLVLTKQ